jgi:hypothetical protein
MGPYVSHFVTNPMLGLRHSTNSTKRLDNKNIEENRAPKVEYFMKRVTKLIRVYKK